MTHEQQNGRDEEDQPGGPEGRRVGGDEEPRESEQDRDGQWCAGVAAQGNAGRDRGGDECDGPDAEKTLKPRMRTLSVNSLTREAPAALSLGANPFTSWTRMPTPMPNSTS